MFFQDDNQNTSSFEPTNTGSGSFVKRAGTEALDAIKPERLVAGLKEVENAATKAAKSFGQIGLASDLIQKTTVESYRQTIKIGATLQDNFDVYQAISKSLQRNAYLTNEQLEGLVTLQRTTNLTAEEIGGMVTGFQDLGQGTDAAVKKTSELAKVARGYGLNVSQFLKTTGENLKLVNAYGFQDGVTGLGRMVARAQALRMDFSKITGLAAQLLSPEKAIDLAAEMQILGGAVGDLADPFKLMYMAENDMEGLQNAVIDTAKSAVMFNEETGQFKITGVEMRRLRAQADALDMSYEDLADTAIKAAKEQKVMESLDFTGLNDQQKQLVANLAEIGTDGQIKLNIPGFKDITDVSKLTKEQFEALEKYQETSQMSEKEIASESLSIQDKQLVALRKIAGAGLLSGEYLSTTEGSKGEDLESLIKSITTATGEETSKTISNFVESSQFTTSVTSFITGNENFLKDLGHSLGAFATEVDKLLTKLPQAMRVNLQEEDPINQFSASLVGLTTTFDTLNTTLFATMSGLTGAPLVPEDMNDGFFPAGSAEIISGPEGSFRLHPEDMVFVGTDPFGTKNSNSGNQNINFNPLKIDITVAGVNNREFETMMKSPEFAAAVRKQIIAGIGAPLGNTTAGYV